MLRRQRRIGITYVERSIASRSNGIIPVHCRSGSWRNINNIYNVEAGLSCSWRRKST